VWEEMVPAVFAYMEVGEGGLRAEKKISVSLLL
jgi:hypothetical protein